MLYRNAEARGGVPYALLKISSGVLVTSKSEAVGIPAANFGAR